jgi:hypothetical protein
MNPRRIINPYNILLNAFGRHFAIQCGQQPQLLYFLADVEDLLTIYRDRSVSGRDPKLTEYEGFFMDLLDHLRDTV